MDIAGLQEYLYKTPVKMGDEIKKSRQYILCTTVLRYSYVRKIDDNTVGWGIIFNPSQRKNIRDGVSW